MNSLDDFAALRPDAEPIDADALDRLWDEIVPPTHTDDGRTVQGGTELIEWDSESVSTVQARSGSTDAAALTGRRRFALLGAAAALVLGAVGVAVVVSGRSASPNTPADQPVTSAPPQGPVVSSVDPALGSVPLWQVTEPGWELSEFSESSNLPSTTEVLGAIAEGGAASGWVILYPTSLELGPPIAEPQGVAEQDEIARFSTGIGTASAPSNLGDLTMNWGGFLPFEAGQAAEVASGLVPSRQASAYRQLDAGGAFDMTRTWSYLFTGPDGQALSVVVRGGGEPILDDFGPFRLPPEDLDLPPGIDDELFVPADDGGFLMARTGFWVTTIETVEPAESVMATFELTKLPELVPQAERVDIEPAVQAGDEVAIGDGMVPEEETVQAVPIAQTGETVGTEVLGERPTWTVDAPGWSQVRRVREEPVEVSPRGTRLFVLERAPGESWITTSRAISQDSTPPSTPEVASDSSVDYQVLDVDGTLFDITAGGVDEAESEEVARAAVRGASLPHGFIEIDPSELAAIVTQDRLEFVGPDGVSITVGVEPLGRPVYDAQTDAFETEPDTNRPGVDESTVLRFESGGSAVIVRTGFWVSSIAVSGAQAADVESLAGLVQLADPARAPVPSTVERLAIGDSVMLGAAGPLSELDYVVDAEESRTFGRGVDIVRELEDQDRLPTTMVVHLGSNGPIGEDEMDEFVELVATVDTVLLVTSAIDRDYTEPSNDLVFAAAAANPNIQVLDWNGFAANCPGDCFEDDGFHLKPDGREFYSTLIAESTGL